MDQKLLKQFGLENEILELIDNADDYTRSDLQGKVSVFVMRNCKNVATPAAAILGGKKSSKKTDEGER